MICSFGSDDSEFEPSKPLVQHSPQTSLSFASPIPLPPSPSVVVDQIDQQAANVRNTLDALWDQSGVSQFSDTLRDKLSNTAIIETLALVIELYGLRDAILPNKYFGMIPSFYLLNTSTPKIDLKVPDVFALLDPVFWSTSSFWFATSVLLPLTFAYYFNFTRKAKRGPGRQARASSAVGQYDLLTFNIAKALLAWSVYSRGVRLGGLVGDDTVQRIEGAIPGGYQGILIGAGIGTLTSIYEVLLAK